nr:MraZ N-terminal domain containing protein [Mycoplasmopsis bovis]
MDSGGLWNMFGEFTRTIDEKNRIAIPAKLRDSLGKQVLYHNWSWWRCWIKKWRDFYDF